ncbi:hypothetical protein JCGZ_20165 [Jatropha curcas]|uniref:Uncharacterized protein n=1 Tax=Jatropha curcas TaxID=180498 RepID=A0A067JUF5_JATCU|nr:hypothetical protein JCGZ_20165 [Jatropha curcas]
MEHVGRNRKSGGERGDCRAHFGHLENRSRKTNAKNELLGKNRAKWSGERSVLSGHDFLATVHGGWWQQFGDRPATLRRGPKGQNSLLSELIMESLPDSQLRERKREWKNNESAGQVRIRPVGQYGGSAPWCRREWMSHVGERFIGVSVTPLTDFHVMWLYEDVNAGECW